LPPSSLSLSVEIWEWESKWYVIRVFIHNYSGRYIFLVPREVCLNSLIVSFLFKALFMVESKHEISVVNPGLSTAVDNPVCNFFAIFS